MTLAINIVLTVVMALCAFFLTHRYLKQEHHISQSQRNALGLISLCLSFILIALIFFGEIGSLSSLKIMGRIVLALMSGVLVVVGIVDAATRYIYDEIIIGFSVLAVLLLAINYKGDWHLLVPHFYGAAAGFLVYATIYVLAKLLYKKEAFGLGDVWLMTSIGFVQGWIMAILTAIFAFYVALIFIIFLFILGGRHKLKDMIAFGPFICIAAYGISIWGQMIVSWYLG